MNGDADPYKKLWSQSDDVSLMGAFGGRVLVWPAVVGFAVAASGITSASTAAGTFAGLAISMVVYVAVALIARWWWIPPP